MKQKLLLLSAGALLGAGLVFAWTQLSQASETASLMDQLEARESRIASLESDLQNVRSSSDQLRSQMETAGLDLSPVKENVIDFERLLNDARPLLKSLTLMFGDQRQRMTEKQLRNIAEKLALDMGLTDEQTEAMLAHFMEVDAQNFDKLKEMLDRKLTVFDVFTVMNDMNPQKAMDAYVMDTMSEEQKAAWENRKLETKAEQLERTANWQLDRMTKQLNLDETQKDRVFEILVKKNPEYDPTLAVEGLAADGAGLAADVSQDEAIAQVLRPEQMDDWTTMQESQSKEKQRWTDALGGLDPTTFFRGLGGMGGMRGGRGGWGR